MFDVEAIIGKRPIRQSGKFEYRIRWKGYSRMHSSWNLTSVLCRFPLSEATWEPIENLGDCLQLVDAYEAKQAVKKRKAEVIDDQKDADYDINDNANKRPRLRPVRSSRSVRC